MSSSNPEKRVEICRLLDIYAEVISTKQRTALEMYYSDDLSLSEIAELSGISRQGVRDAVRHGEDSLRRLEAALGVAGLRERVHAAADRIAHLSDNPDIRTEVEKLRSI